MRFLTTYPKRLPSGKNAPWYFVSRLAATNNQLLAVFQGQGYYQFATLSLPDSGNINQNLPFVGDIEGIWTYLYFSYSAANKKVVAWLQFGDAEPSRV